MNEQPTTTALIPKLFTIPHALALCPATIVAHGEVGGQGFPLPGGGGRRLKKKSDDAARDKKTGDQE